MKVPVDMKRIYLSPPHLDGREKELLVQAYESNWITTLGPQVDAFEVEMCQRTSIPNAAVLLHIVLLNSAY